MLRAPRLVERPQKRPVDVAAVRSYCVLPRDVPDAKIELAIDGATERLDGYRGWLGRCLISQIWSQDFNDSHGARLRLAFPDVSSASAVTVPVAGDPADVSVVTEEDIVSPFVMTVGGPYRDTVRVTFTAGYGTTSDDVPAAIREAILLDVGLRLRSVSENGPVRSETVEGIGATSFSSPEQVTIAAERQIANLLRPFRRGNV